MMRPCLLHETETRVSSGYLDHTKGFTGPFNFHSIMFEAENHNSLVIVHYGRTGERKRGRESAETDAAALIQ